MVQFRIDVRILTPGLTRILIIPQAASKLDLHIVWFDSSVCLERHPLRCSWPLTPITYRLLGVVLQYGSLVVPPDPLVLSLLGLLGLLVTHQTIKTIKCPVKRTSNINIVSHKTYGYQRCFGSFKLKSILLDYGGVGE